VDKSGSVQRVVLTSTVGAIFGDDIDVRAMAAQRLSERYFNTTSTLENNPYMASMYSNQGGHQGVTRSEYEGMVAFFGRHLGEVETD
jgi:hypothetical protein